MLNYITKTLKIVHARNLCFSCSNSTNYFIFDIFWISTLDGMVYLHFKKIHSHLKHEYLKILNKNRSYDCKNTRFVFRLSSVLSAIIVSFSSMGFVDFRQFGQSKNENRLQ